MSNDGPFSWVQERLSDPSVSIIWRRTPTPGGWHGKVPNNQVVEGLNEIEAEPRISNAEFEIGVHHFVVEHREEKLQCYRDPLLSPSRFSTLFL